MASSNFLDLIGLNRFKEKLLELVDKKLADKQDAGEYLTADDIDDVVRTGELDQLVHKTGNETIAGVKTFSSTISGSVSGSAAKLATARTIGLSGDVSGSGSFDGSGNLTITATVADDSHNHVISNVDGLQTALNAKAALASPALTGTPTAPTAAAGTNTTQVATTAFVTTAVANKTSATKDGSGNVITDTYLTKSDAAVTYLGIDNKAASAKVADSASAVAWSGVTGKPSSYTPAAHNQASSTINALTGYSKPSSTSALTTGDTLNGALGKLEKALDGKLSTSGVAAKATADASGNTITSTYATKTALTTGLAGKADTGHTHDAATTSAAGFMSAADKKKLDGIAAGANNYTYTLPTASSSTLGGVKTTSTVTSTSGLTACPIINGVPYYKDTNTTYSLSTFDVTATAAELNVLDGITATTAELNYVDGVTSNIQTQLNGKLSTSGTAAKATADASGNTITTTYATKAEISAAVKVVSSGEGYRVLSDGRIEQWGKVLVANGNGTRLVFPLAFAEAVESVTCTASGGVPVSYAVEPEENLGAATIKHNGDGGVVTYYRAIGR